MKNDRSHELLEGFGTVYRGGVPIFERVHYLIECSRYAGASEPLIDGQILIADTRSRIELVGVTLELELQDGRRWLCAMQTSRGRLVNAGGIVERLPAAAGC